MGRLIRISALALGTGAMLTTPAHAEDATKTGILAGLGVAAASGKTSLGEGAGAIEAGLLNADSMRQAAAIIAGLVQKQNTGNRPLVVIGKTGAVDFISYKLVIKRLDAAERALKDAENQKCDEEKKSEQTKKNSNFDFVLKSPIPGTSENFIPSPNLSDIGILLTDTSIGPISIEASEQRMVNAMLMQGAARPISATVGNWVPYSATDPSGSTKMSMRVTDEPVAWAASENLRAKSAYNNLVKALENYKNKCKDKSRAELGKSAATLAEKVTDASAGPSILARAMQAESIATGRPLLLRVVIEQIGGTAISRNGVLYSFGWPNAATVSAGLLVSFRLIDPEVGGVNMVGEVRCLTSQTNIKHIRDVLQHDFSKRSKTPDAVTCDYRTS